LAKEFPLAEVIGIDLAPGMIEVAKRKCKLNNLSFMVGDGECLSSFGSTFDLIVTNASLQWMEARKFFNEVRKVLEVDGTLALSTFGPQTLQELKRVGFSINTFPSFLELLTLLGEFEPLFLQTKLIKRNFKSVKEIIYHLKELGASYQKKVERGNHFDPFSALKEYREKFGTEVTFEVIFIVTSRRIN
jgi:malonyl-CoA O-methyltransferase